MIGEPRLSRSHTFFTAIPAPGSSISTATAHRASGWAGGSRAAPDRCRAMEGCLVNGKASGSKEREQHEARRQPGDNCKKG